MWARVATIRTDPSRTEEAIALVNDYALPRYREMPGFRHGSWLLDRSSGAALAVTMFDTEDQMRESFAPLVDLRDRVAAIGATIEGLAEFEVIGHQ
jgi:hypothetical protein